MDFVLITLKRNPSDAVSARALPTLGAEHANSNPIISPLRPKTLASDFFSPFREKPGASNH